MTNSDAIGLVYNVKTLCEKHTDCPNPNKFAELEQRRKLKEKAKVSDEPPRKIMSAIDENITIDFEKAFLNACSTVFPGVPMYCCFFHFSQNMWRKIQEIGLSKTYLADESIRKLLKLPQILAFVPPGDVETVFLSQRSNFSDAQVLEIYDYFQTNYIGVTTFERARF